MMGDAVEGSRWDIELESPCYKCQRGTHQLIEIGPTNATVTCTHCFRERHYTLHSIDLPEKKPLFEDAGYRREHDVWDLKYSARCPNCGNCVDNEVNVDERRIRTFCPECYFTRTYDFNMYTEPRSRR
jgi:NMD protein affecting ribosome stability and mRNA decay